MAKLNVGIIGTGSIGNVHLMGYATMPREVKIQALCDITPARLAEMGEKYNVPEEHRYLDYKKMLDAEKLDVVSICVPNALHFACASEAIRHGVNTLIEKPMVLDPEDAKKLKQLAARKKVKSMIAFSHRFHAMNIEAKKMIEKGAIGDPFMIRVRYAHTGPYPGWAQSDWFYKKKIAGGGAVLDMGIHAIDICQFLIGPITSVTGKVATLRKKIEVDDNAVMLLDFAPKKCIGYIEVGWTCCAGFCGIEIYGDKGCIVLDLYKGAECIRGTTMPDGTMDMKTEKFAEGGVPNWQFQQQSFIKHVQGKKTAASIPTLDDGLSSLLVALGAEKSSKTGKRVELKKRTR